MYKENRHCSNFSFLDGTRNFKTISLTSKMVPRTRPCQPKAVVTNAHIAAVAGLNKRDARLTVKNIAHSVDISSGSAHKKLIPTIVYEICS